MQKVRFSISVLYYGDLSSFRVLSLFSALYCSMPQLDSCVPACNHELEALIVGEPKSRIVQKHTFFAPERYTAGILYTNSLNSV